MKKFSEREAAVFALKEITEVGAYSNEALRRFLGTQGHFERVQKAFVTEIVAGCVRNLLLIDHIIGNFSKTPVKKLKPMVLGILRVSVYQLKFMDKVPTFAVCNEAVEMTKKHGLSGLSGFVNGVLRNIARAEIAEPEDLSIRYSVQPWIVEHFVGELGESAAVQVLESMMKPPVISICVNTLKTTVDELIEILVSEGVMVQRGNLEGSLMVSKTSDIAALQSFKDGLYHVMDEGAMLAVHAAAPPANARIIDLCAAPGGKAFLAAYMAGAGAEILACDVHAHKIKLLEQGAARLGLANVKTALHDARIFRPELEETADLVIADVPCSGLGTLRKRPDLKLNKQPESMETLAGLAREIIKNSWRYVKIGGRLLFSTCTISNVENMDNFEWIKANLPFKAVESKMILPSDFDSDGFFIAVLERVE
ncbi:MAG: 16S rRNA (cytosine(967)-C(5))-methyltransferase RsmB [Defluviitaleaceae bacterium]|nr:16S rRNA (cytosine(967)-C(5))-methyltransferase RsmB [Defluviitaleaceae bacterium]